MDDDNTSKSNLPPGRFKNIRQKFEMGSPPQDEENNYAVINDKESNNDIVVAPKPVPRQAPTLKQKPSIKGQKPHFDEKGTPPIIIPRTKRDSFVKKEHLNNSSDDLGTVKNLNSDIESSENNESSAGRTHRRGLSDCSTGQHSFEDDVKPEIFRNQRCSSGNIESDSSDGSGDGALVSKRLRVFQTPTPSKKPEIAPRPASMIGFTSSLPRKKVARNLSIKETSSSASPSKNRPLHNASPTFLKLSQDDNIYKDKNKEKDNADNEDKVPKPPPKPPNLPVGAPPKKPPRTYKHDEFLKNKDSTVFKDNELYESSENFIKKPITKAEVKETPKRPPRPPPPRPPIPRDDLDALNGVEVYVDEEGYAVPYKFVVKDPNFNIQSHKETTKQFDLLEKIQDLKRRFGDPHAKTNSTRSSHHEPKLSRGKVNLVRQKINQSYAMLQKHTKKLPDAPYLDGTLPDMESADGDSLVDESEIKKRLDYCNSVKARTSERIKKSLRVLDKIYPQLFEYVLSVGLRLNVEQKTYEPYIIYKFPEIVDSNLSIPHFCFPDAEVYQPQEGMTSDTYCFVLTNFDGARVYGYCRRIWPFGPRLLPEVICIISPIEAINMYNALLNEMEASRMKSPEAMQELMASSFGRPLPSPGKAVQIRTMNYIGEVDTIELRRPMDSRLEGVNLDCLLSTLGVEKLIWIFSTLLVERSVILCARNLSLLCSTVHALVALLYPFQWQHTYIPVLPSKMLEVVCSPTPYIVGVLYSYLPKIKNMQMEEVVILDLDRKHFVSNIGDESSILPKKIQKALKSALDICRNDFDSDGSKNLMISEAFIRLFVELVGHIGNHVTTQQDGEKIFQREQFIRSVNSKSIRKFLEWFTETQMFDVFKHSLIDISGSLELFLTRVFEHTSDNSGVKSNVKDFGKKMRNFGKALKTKFAPDSSL
ncbi:DENND2 [Acanthosepion pharaonis]|uniref:DENND2 n=1 Tax=Acanthosepion pharaonis TaxID=158019 RepID=A0A812C589_ACAPH|nr:DENND2 [Sepia pharaonis]